MGASIATGRAQRQAGKPTNPRRPAAIRAPVLRHDRKIPTRPRDKHDSGHRPLQAQPAGSSLGGAFTLVP
jgi:hypothetical protein